MITAWLKKSFHYIWSGWGALASILLFLALWNYGSHLYGNFILPSPKISIDKLISLFGQGLAFPALWITTYRVFIGFGLAVIIGSFLGTLAGLSNTLSMAMRPLITILIGIPPIAWIVLALLWFGSNNSTPIFTIIVTALPITFIGGVQGARTLDKNLTQMAQSFGASRWLLFCDVHLPHILSYLFPAWTTALGTSWKVVVMAELLACDSGVGAGLANARVNIDTPGTMAWILAIVMMLLLVEYGVFEPIKRSLEKWRESN